ncbi:hypothetical protein ONZ45_g13256 [Pleurotus djamor]|nr:hypothetical protein ONZ45_g13256 [Pleurotus djamor]
MTLQTSKWEATVKKTRGSFPKAAALSPDEIPCYQAYSDRGFSDANSANQYQALTFGDFQHATRTTKSGGCHHLNNKMLKDALHTMGENAPFNYNQGNLQQDAPPIAEYFRSTIFANPIGIQITSALLGPNPRWSFCSGNTAMSSSPDVKPQRQPVHSDADFKYPNHPFALVINVPLVTMTPENGSTELWLGTHTLDPSMQEGSHGDRASGRIKEPYLSRQRALRPPSQPIVKKGSIVIRDLRLWHAGMPNYSNEVRVMLAMIHFSSCYRNQMRLRFAHDIKPILEKEVEGLEIPVDWISVKEAQGGYLNRGFGNSYDFNQLP